VDDAPGEITVILREVARGEGRAMDGLLAALYGELRDLADRELRRERRDHTLQPTALVNELYCKLIDQRQADWNDRAHFFGAAAQLMRRILIDHARTKKRLRRGGGHERLHIDEVDAVMRRSDLDLVELDDALRRLAEIREIQARVVELRFFGGLTIEEAAAVLGIGKRTVDREWVAAKAWLLREFSGAEKP